MAQKKDKWQRRMLLLEDDLDLGHALAEALQDQYQVTLAHSWLDAHACLKEHRYDAVVLDLYIPDAALLEPLEQIRQIDPDYPVVAMSGYVDTEDDTIDRLMRLGVNKILHKPFSFQALQCAIEQAIQKSP